MSKQPRTSRTACPVVQKRACRTLKEDSRQLGSYSEAAFLGGFVAVNLQPLSKRLWGSASASRWTRLALVRFFAFLSTSKIMRARIASSFVRFGDARKAWGQKRTW